MAQHVHHVFLRPFAEEAVITVLALGDIPFVERLQHHHKAHLVAQFHQFGSRHVVGGTYRVATHVLQHRQLAAQGSHIHGSPQRTEVVMVAHPLELAVLPVQEETLVGHNLQAADAETGRVFIRLPVIHVNLRYRLIQERRFGRPQLRGIYQKVLLKGHSVIDFARIVFHRYHLPFG